MTCATRECSRALALGRSKFNIGSDTRHTLLSLSSRSSLYRVYIPRRHVAQVAARPEGFRFRPGPTVMKSLTLDPYSVRERSYLADMSDISLRDHLRKAAETGDFDRVATVIKHLVDQRNIKPDVYTYTSLILVNVNPEKGSVHRVNNILADMEARGIALDSGVCHAVLAVLSVHPDHTLRADILNFMDERWLRLSRDGHHHLAAGYLREGDLEHGLAVMQDLRQQGFKVEGWLSDLAILLLLSVRDVAGAQTEIITRTSAGRDTVPQDVWQVFLDAAGDVQSLAAVAYVWKTQVDTGIVRPSIGSCRAALQTATRHGDAALASKVLEHLAIRGATIGVSEYSLLAHAYLSAGDLDAAFTTVSVALEDGIHFTRPWTRPLYSCLKKNKAYLQRAKQVLRKIHDRGRKIPLPLVNTILEAHAANDDYISTEELYKSMHVFEEHHPDDEPRLPFADETTFEALYRAARAARPDPGAAARFIRTEQAVLRVPWTGLMLDRLLLVYRATGEFEEMPELLDLVERNGYKLRPNTVRELMSAREEEGSEVLDDWVDMLQASTVSHTK